MKVVIFGKPPDGVLDELVGAPSDEGDAIDLVCLEMPKSVDDLTLRELKDVDESDHVFVVVDVDGEEAAFDLVATIKRRNISAGAITTHATREFLAHSLRVGASPMIESAALGTPGWEASRRGIAAARARVMAAVAVPPSGATEFGDILPLPAEQSDYERSRSLSLFSASMQEFLEDLGDAVRDLRLHAEDQLDDPGVTRRPGWEQDGTPGNWWPNGIEPSETKGKRRNPRPTLDDLFTWSEHPQAREILQSDEAGLDRARRHGAPASVLIRGESGSGKSLVANLIRDILDGGNSSAPDAWHAPRVDVNCAGMSANNFDHEMFGSGPGRWTGIDRSVVGSMAQASRGTIFLDEIGDMPWDGQGRLLKFLDDGMIRPEFVHPFPGYLQIIAATNRNLESLIRRGLFKHDLLARFRVQVTIPPLRSREPEERRRLIDFVAQNPRYNPVVGGHRVVRAISEEALHHLTTAGFAHGNFRELEVTVHMALRNARRRKSQVLDVVDLPNPVAPYLDDDAARIVEAAEDVVNVGSIVPMASFHDLDRLAMQVGAPLIREPGGDIVVVQPGVVYRFSPRREG